MATIDSTTSCGYAYTFKFLVLGDSCVGKSNLVLRLTENRFDESLQFTIGLDFKHKTFKVNNERILARILDTAGQERFHSLTPSTYRNLDGVALVFCVANPSSFENVQKWMDQLTEHVDEDIPIVLIANMVDRTNDDRRVSREDGRRLAQRLDLQYFEVSAKSGKNVTHTFQSLVNLAYLRRKRAVSMIDVNTLENTVKIKETKKGMIRRKC